jgi:hypothetical protein
LGFEEEEGVEELYEVRNGWERRESIDGMEGREGIESYKARFAEFCSKQGTESESASALDLLTAISLVAEKYRGRTRGRE